MGCARSPLPLFPRLHQVGTRWLQAATSSRPVEDAARPTFLDRRQRRHVATRADPRRTRRRRVVRLGAIPHAESAGVTAERLLGIGVDGAPGGWLAACCFGDELDGLPEGRRSEPLFFRSVLDLAAWRAKQPGGTAAPVAIDIPIGLPETVSF